MASPTGESRPPRAPGGPSERPWCPTWDPGWRVPGRRKPAEAPMRELVASRATQPRGLLRGLRGLRSSPTFGWGALHNDARSGGGGEELEPRGGRSVRRRASGVRGARSGGKERRGEPECADPEGEGAGEMRWSLVLVSGVAVLRGVLRGLLCGTLWWTPWSPVWYWVVLCGGQ